MEDDAPNSTEWRNGLYFFKTESKPLSVAISEAITDMRVYPEIKYIEG